VNKLHIPAPRRAGNPGVERELQELIAVMRRLSVVDPNGYRALLSLIRMVEKKSS
jgi:hypothetical protein